MNQPSFKPNCIRCAHYYVTWEKPHSNGCKAHQFKSAEYPSVVVQRTSGIPCQLFLEKNLSEKK